jgi:hypothetical protein
LAWDRALGTPYEPYEHVEVDRATIWRDARRICEDDIYPEMDLEVIMK